MAYDGVEGAVIQSCHRGRVVVEVPNSQRLGLFERLGLVKQTRERSTPVTVAPSRASSRATRPWPHAMSTTRKIAGESKEVKQRHQNRIARIGEAGLVEVRNSVVSCPNHDRTLSDSAGCCGEHDGEHRVAAGRAVAG